MSRNVNVLKMPKYMLTRLTFDVMIVVSKGELTVDYDTHVFFIGYLFNGVGAIMGLHSIRVTCFILTYM